MAPVRPWRRNSLPVGVAGIVVIILLIGVLGVCQPSVLANPIVSAAATGAVGAAAGFVTKRALRSRTRLRWQLSR
ncbi:hypothetical protein ACIRVF_41425 [Kitasatospora sp. NPDC101157]|uniref:hypothetical protein n=1 Tax=Kitasatospora sp. NPDC101157 TaxID=3364098 RepID=UPI0038079C63